jgi:hypothetical protein
MSFDVYSDFTPEIVNSMSYVTIQKWRRIFKQHVNNGAPFPFVKTYQLLTQAMIRHRSQGCKRRIRRFYTNAVPTTFQH